MPPLFRWFFAAVLVCSPVASAAADGALDPTFGIDGVAMVDVTGGDDDQATALEILPDGTILLAGYAFPGVNRSRFAVARLRADGTPDPTFGVGGAVMTELSEFSSGIAELVLLPDGRFVAAGFAYPTTSDAQFAVARYHADGRLDETFGVGGTVLSDVAGRSDFGWAAARQSDGAIVVAGASHVGTDLARAISVARYTADGALDATFGDGGTLTTSITGDADEARAVLVQPDGRILVAGFAEYQSGAATLADLVVLRYHADGSLDGAFATGGVARFRVGSWGYARAFALALDAGGRIIVAGEADNGVAAPDFDFVVGRLLPNGRADATFGTGGFTTSAFDPDATEPVHERARDVAVDPSGRILLAGSSEARGYVLARYDGDGALDPGWGGSGVASTVVCAAGEKVTALSVDATTAVVAGDCALGLFNHNFAAVRWLVPAVGGDPDGGPTHSDAGAPSPDAASSSPADGESAGCGCVAGAAPRPVPWLALLPVATTVFVWRRRSRVAVPTER